MRASRPLCNTMSIAAVAALAAAATFAPGSARADRRAYVWTYEYLTVPRGEAEIETYFTISAPAKSDLEGRATSEHRVELEIGMNDRFDFAVYQIFSQGPGESLSYDGYQLRWRYRLGEKDRYLLDPLLYFEYKGVPDFAEHGFEGKLILAKDVGRLNVSLNPIFGLERADGENELEAAYAAGASYALSDIVRIGLEAKGNEDAHFVGPVIAHGGERFWGTIGSAIGVAGADEGETELQIRMLLGVGL